MSFVATCIEATSRLYGVPYQQIVERMKRVGLIQNYIIPNYEVLHTESRENIAANIMECLDTWEKKQ